MADISQIKLPNGDIFDLVDGSKSTATNWVNGSQTGSVRTINSKAEDSSYTIGTYAVAEGHNTKANGDYGSHAEGTSTTASGNYSHAEGGGATASGGGAHAEGGGTTASGENSHAEGGGTQASGSQAHAEGGSSVASASNAHAEGYDTRASALGAHAEGNGTKASGSQSHAEGFETEASGATSHAEGTGTIANHNSQHVFGRYNISDSSAAGIGEIGNYIEIVGNGTNSNARSNARTLDWSGNEWLAGKLTLGTAGSESMDVATIGQLPTTTSQLTNDSGFITSYTETDPVFSASAAAGITATDISNWNAKISDDKTWNGVELNTTGTTQGTTSYIPARSSISATTAYQVIATTEPFRYRIAKWDDNAYLYSTTPSANDNSTKVATTAYVDSAIDALPEPMVFKGSVGTGGTITTLPTAAASNEGHTYKVITALSSPSAKVGDTVISNGSEWIVVPSGDEPNGTVTSITTGAGLTGGTITTSGTIKANLNSETSLGTIGTTDKLYAIGVDSNGKLAVNVPWISGSSATNWVNGSSTGSVRTINSAAEDSSYIIGQYAVAEGQSTKATGKYSHAEGGGTTASGTGSHAEGAGTQAKGANSHAEGGGAIANGNQSHAEGSGTTAGGPDSHAEGNYTTASGDASHAEGGGTQASGQYSHAEGASTVASNNKDHAEGYQTTASGGCAHAEGYGTVASGLDSHAEGDSTIANHLAQHVFGQYNIADVSTATADNKGKYVEIVGNGSYNARSNARTLDWSGNEVLAGKLTVGVAGTNSLDVATIGQLPTKTSDLTNDSNFISDSAYIHTDNNYTTIEKNKLNGIAEGAEANVNANWNENDSTSASYIQNRPFYFEEDAEVVIFEEDVNFSNNYNGVLWNSFSYTFTDAIAVGTPVKLTVDDITLDTTIEIEIEDDNRYAFIGIRDPADSTRAATNHIGLALYENDGYAYSTYAVLASASMFSVGVHHVKLITFADVYHKLDNNFLGLNIENGSGIKSIQQIGATANGECSSAFGLGIVTSFGSYAHAEGSSTTASGKAAHAEGDSTTASGDFSHAEGYYTTAKNRSQHVFGEYNIADPSAASAAAKGNYVEIVGNGTRTSARSNARTLDWSGNEVLAGKLTVGAVGVNSMDVATVGQIPNVPSWAMASTKPTYTANEVGALPATTTIPSKTSELTNDSGFITSSALPTNLSDLTNDCGFAKIHISTAEPTSTDGDDGDIWIQYTE